MKDFIKALKDLEQKVEELTLYHKEFFTTKEAAKFLGVSCSTLHKWMCFKLISFYKPNHGNATFTKADLVGFLTRNRVPSNEELRKEVGNGK
jgi:excisionase family DNA binding protein